MANSVEIGCESGSSGGPVEALYEAIKAKGNSVSFNVAQESNSILFPPSNSMLYGAVALRFDEQYVVSIGYCRDNTDVSKGVVATCGSLNGVVITASFYGLNPQIRQDTYVAVAVNKGYLNIYQSRAEMYYIVAPTYEQLMRQLGGA